MTDLNILGFHASGLLETNPDACSTLLAFHTLSSMGVRLPSGQFGPFADHLSKVDNRNDNKGEIDE